MSPLPCSPSLRVSRVCTVSKTNLRVNMYVSLTSKHKRNPTLWKGVQCSIFIQTRCFSYIIFYSLSLELSTSRFLDDSSNFEMNISVKSRINSLPLIALPHLLHSRPLVPVQPRWQSFIFWLYLCRWWNLGREDRVKRGSAAGSDQSSEPLR